MSLTYSDYKTGCLTKVVSSCRVMNCMVLCSVKVSVLFYNYLKTADVIA